MPTFELSLLASNHFLRIFDCVVQFGAFYFNRTKLEKTTSMVNCAFAVLLFKEILIKMKQNTFQLSSHCSTHQEYILFIC